MEIYKQRQSQFEQQYAKQRKKYKQVGALRLLLFFALVWLFYLGVRHAEINYVYAALGVLVLFLGALRWHVSLVWDMDYFQALVQINAQEDAFVRNDKREFDCGSEFEVADHPYTYDLDIFGPRGLYEFLNRTASFAGRQKLADYLSAPLQEREIPVQQEAIREVVDKVDWRQRIHAYAKLSTLEKSSFVRLQTWLDKPSEALSKATILLSIVLPLVFVGSSLAYFFSSAEFLGYIISLSFSLNLILALRQGKKIQSEVASFDKISQSIMSYSAMIAEVEKESFTSVKMRGLIQKLNSENFVASQELARLSKYFEQLETVANLFVMVVFNGVFQYHVHVLNKLLLWKKDKSSVLKSTVEVIAEIEALNSLANYAYNNPNYTYAEVSAQNKMYFESLGHPLLSSKNRVCNTIDFSQNRLVILTGSNMSGKSTFLRTVGINLVLAGCGAPICSTKAEFVLMPLLVSMRLTDSLDDSESYFFAEVKRLKSIMNKVQKQRCFVLLDEILRGTNSDDKQSGTIGVIKKLLAQPTYGVIATHDLEVCATTNLYPDILTNKCFEVEIVQDELRFDYTLRPGICQNKNATFIMTKMGII